MVILHGRVGVNTSLRNMPHSTKRFLTEQCLSAVTKKPIIKHPDFVSSQYVVLKSILVFFVQINTERFGSICSSICTSKVVYIDVLVKDFQFHIAVSLRMIQSLCN